MIGIDGLPLNEQQLQALLDARVATLAIVLLLVLVLMIGPVMLYLLRNNRKSDAERYALQKQMLDVQLAQATANQQNSIAIEAIRAQVLSNETRQAERATGEMALLHSMVEAVQGVGKDTSDAVGASFEKIKKDADEGRRRMAEFVEGVAKSGEMMANHSAVVGKLDVMQRDVTLLKPYGQVVYLIAETIQDQKLLLEQVAAKMTADKEFTAQQREFWEEMKTATITRLDTLEKNVEKLMPAARPKTEPIPPLPASINLPILPTTTADTAPVVPPHGADEGGVRL